MTENIQLNNALLRLSKRAESADRSKLVETFVDTGALSTLLEGHDHQIIYGRRGTGKTHALLYLADRVHQKGDLAAYIDMRRIGSTGGLYHDSEASLPERAIRLIVDTISSIHEQIFQLALLAPDLNLGVIGPALDALANSLSSITMMAPPIGQSKATHRVHFGTTGSALTKLASALFPKRLWILLDEWSVTPLDLQPYLADLLRRTLLPVPNTSLKIAAIEQRSNFQISYGKGDYVGIEVGADASADLNLDDFMVFDNNADRATKFFQDLLFRHFKAVEADAGITDGPPTSQQFIKAAFTQKTPFEELVAAAEGVPRDAINIIGLSAQRAGAERISIPHVRTAAKLWYQRDKETAVAASAKARALLHWIADEVIAHRRARAFLIRSGERHPLIDHLFDARVIHLLKRGVAAHDQPGMRYDVFKIDYGCYVDLFATNKAPQGLLSLDTPEGSTSHTNVPPDDYRAIRRAILNLEKFENENQEPNDHERT